MSSSVAPPKAIVRPKVAPKIVVSAASSECAVKIAVRERPRQPADSTRESVLASQTKEADSVVERAGAEADNIIVVGDRPFVFDAILGPAVGQQQLYEQLVAPLVDKLLQGYFCTVLAYGQTGTGKSYTMGMHTEAFASDQGGVVPRTLRDIFARVQASNADGSTETTLTIAFIEIYNEKVIDLLAKSTEANNENDCNNTTVVSMVSSSTTAKPVPPPSRFAGPTRRPVRNIAEAQRALADGNRERHVRPTKMNAQSSRSHAICTVHATVRAANRHTVAAMHLVDLAGSEGVRRTGAQGAALAEGVHINQGLLSMGKVLQALSTGQRVVPYRDSVLSTVLQDSLNGNAFLTLLACISPLQADLNETLSTLRFADGAKSLRLSPQVNAIVAQIKKTRTPAKLKTPKKHMLPAAAASASAAKKTAAEDALPLGSRHKTPIADALRKTLFRQSTAANAHKARVGNALQRPVPGLNARRTFAASTPAVQVPKRPEPQAVPAADESEMFLDVSSSTAFEQPAAEPFAGPSYSPIVRLCVQEVEQKIQEKMREKMRDLMQSIAADSTFAPIAAAVPMPPIEQSTIVETDAADDATVVEAPNTVRRSRRQSSHISVANISWNTLTRGLREIVRDELNAIQMTNTAAEAPTTCTTTTTHDDANDDDNVTALPSFRPPAAIGRRRRNTTAAAVPTTLRRSARISMRRLSTLDETPAVPEPKRRRPNNQPTASKKTTAMEAFVQQITDARNPTKTRADLVLGLFNKGTLRELQILPTVGPKLAFQIITHRSSLGSIRNLTEMAAMPIWRGKSWDRFMVANCLL